MPGCGRSYARKAERFASNIRGLTLVPQRGQWAGHTVFALAAVGVRPERIGRTIVQCDIRAESAYAVLTAR